MLCEPETKLRDLDDVRSIFHSWQPDNRVYRWYNMAQVKCMYRLCFHEVDSSLTKMELIEAVNRYLLTVYPAEGKSRWLLNQKNENNQNTD